MDQKPLTDFDKQLICAALQGLAASQIRRNCDTARYAIQLWRLTKDEIEREGYRAD